MSGFVRRSCLVALLFVVMVSVCFTMAFAQDRDNNPPGPKGGQGTNWENKPGPQGGPGAGPDRGKGPGGDQYRQVLGKPSSSQAAPEAGSSAVKGPNAPQGQEHMPEVLKEKAVVDQPWEKKADTNGDGIVDRVEIEQWKRLHPKHPDLDNNPPGPKGGPGTNWENKPGPQGGPGAGPNRKHGGK